MAKKHTAVVIWLHGLGDSPSGLYTQDFLINMSGPELEHIRWMTPAAPNQPSTCNGGRVMPSWFDMPAIPVKPDSPYSTEEEVTRAAASIHALIDAVVEEGIEPTRIIVGGFSQGAATALASAMTYPRTLGGAAVLWGWVPLEPSLFKAKITKGGRKTPVIWSHGRSDFVVEYGCAEQGRAMLKEAGVGCGLRGYADVGHHPHANERILMKAWMTKLLPAAVESEGLCSYFKLCG
eukprot:jgi/Mesen1/6810/ME000035S06185